MAIAARGGGGGGSTTGGGATTTIGKGEGSLNVIEWPYYTDQRFAKPFEKQTGCIIHRKDAGSSQEMFALMHANGGGGAASTTSSRPRATRAFGSSTRATSSRSTSI